MKLLLLFVFTLVRFTFQVDEICTNQDCVQLSKQYQSYMRPEVSPCDDFYEYACGNFEKVNPLDDENTRILAFSFREKAVSHEVDQAIRAADNSKSNTVRFLSEIYTECNASDVLETRGYEPLIQTINEVVGGWPLLGKADVKQRDMLDIFVDTYTKLGFVPLFKMGVQYVPNLKKKMFFLLPGGTGLTQAVLNNQAANPNLVLAYKTYIRMSAIELGAEDNAELTQAVNDIVELEQKFAKIFDPIGSIFTKLDTFASLNLQTHNVIDWINVLNTILKRTNSTATPFQETDQVIVSDTEFMEQVIQIVETTPVSKLQNLFGWLTVMQLGTLTKENMRSLALNYSAVLTGVRQVFPHWRLCYNYANNRLPFALARVYVDAHFNTEDKKEATILVEEIKNSFQNIMTKEDWLDETTRKSSLEKLEAIKENVGFPEWVVNDTELDEYYAFLKNHKVIKGKFFESVLEIQRGIVREEFNTMATPVNHSYLWPMTPATVNAAYYPTENSITIPAAILKTPFFDKDRPIALNYGSIGAIIGHELTHGFDTIGSRFDKNGETKNWWSPHTLSLFTNKSQCFVKQYGELIEPKTMMRINGQHTVSENIADNGGIKESFYAMHNHEQKYGKSKLLPDIKMNADQLFFLGYANNWCSNNLPAITKQLILYNAHTPEIFRVNTVLANFDEFAKTFNCPANSKMNPKERCIMW